MMHRLWRYDVFRFAQNDVAPLAQMMHLLRKYGVAPFGRSDAMLAPMCPQAHIIQKTHLCHKTKVRFLLRKSDQTVRKGWVKTQKKVRDLTLLSVRQIGI